MADPAKKPARKPAKKRGPTKAAALKALGLTQEDLDALKALTDAQSAPQVVEASAVAHPVSNTADSQRILEDRPAPEFTAPEVPQVEAAVPTFYMRNLRGVEVNFRLTRQDAQGEKRTHLNPRGQRGDLQPLRPEDLKDVALQTQVGYGLIEIIPEGEALEVIRKQTTNAQTTVPAHILALRNEKGEAYADQNPVKMASDEEAYGIKVADLDPAAMQGKLTDKELHRSGGFAQQDLVGPVQTPSPGRVVEDGFVQQAPQSNNEQAAQVDALARSKEFEGPGAGLGKVNVVVEPVRRT